MGWLLKRNYVLANTRSKIRIVRPTFSQFKSFKICRLIFLSYIKFVDPSDFEAFNCKRVGRVGLEVTNDEVGGWLHVGKVNHKKGNPIDRQTVWLRKLRQMKRKWVRGFQPARFSGLNLAIGTDNFLWLYWLQYQKIIAAFYAQLDRQSSRLHISQLTRASKSVYGFFWPDFEAIFLWNVSVTL